MYTLKEILTSETKPALGCTEPAAIALNAAYLKEYLSEFSNIKLTINTNLLKNAMYVPIPNTDRKFGVKFAFALGLVCGDKNKKLNLFEDVTQECIKKAEEVIKKIDLKVKDGNEIYIKSECDGIEVVSEKFHDYISYIKTGDEFIRFSYKTGENDVWKIEKWLKKQNVDVLYDLVEKENEFSYILNAVKMNMVLAETGLTKSCGLNIGKSVKGESVYEKVLSVTTAASDARMEGVNLPAMSLIGSGNHGIAATLPVWIYGKEKGFEEKEILRSVALSMLVTVYVKLYIGRLSAICGAAFASGCGVAAGIAYLESKERKISKNAIAYVIQTINGVICDGAKMGCALKVFLGAKSGYEAAMFAVETKPVFSDGILENDITGSIRNLEKISENMKPVDSCIVEIMKEKVQTV